MNKLNDNKKSWVKPSVHLLIIKKDTFSGSVQEPEGKGGALHIPADPTPR